MKNGNGNDNDKKERVSLTTGEPFTATEKKSEKESPVIDNKATELTAELKITEEEEILENKWRLKPVDPMTVEGSSQLIDLHQEKLKMEANNPDLFFATTVIQPTTLSLQKITLPFETISQKEVEKMMQTELDKSSPGNYQVKFNHKNKDFELTIKRKKGKDDNIDNSAALQAARFREALQDITNQLIKNSDGQHGNWEKNKNGEFILRIPVNHSHDFKDAKTAFQHQFIDKTYRSQIQPEGKFHSNFDKFFANPLLEVYQNSKTTASKAKKAISGLFLSKKTENETEQKILEVDRQIKHIKSSKTDEKTKFNDVLNVVNDAKNKNAGNSFFKKLFGKIEQFVSSLIHHNKPKSFKPQG